MKTFLLAFLLCFSVGIVAVAQDSPIPAPQKHQAARIQSTSIMGTVSEHGEKLRFVTDQRTWNVDNPETLKGHEGHYVRVNAHVYADKGSIHITEVKTPTAGESRRHDLLVSAAIGHWGRVTHQLHGSSRNRESVIAVA